MGLDPANVPRFIVKDGEIVPDGLTELLRRVEALEAKERADIASVAQSFSGTVATLTDLVNTQIDTLTDAASATGMGFPSAETTLFATAPVAVPAIYTSALVLCNASGRCLNNTGASVYFGVRPRIETSDGSWANGGIQQIALAAGYQGTVDSTLIFRFTLPGIAGQTMTFKTWAYASSATTADAGNYAGLSYVVLMTRT